MMTLGPLAETVFRHKYSLNGTETWEECAQRVAKHVMRAVGYRANDPMVKALAKLIADRKFIPGGRYLYASGRPYHQTQNCLLLRAEDSREGWADLLHKSSMALMTGAGIGIDYSNVRAAGKAIRRTGGTATGPMALMAMLNECGRGIMQGGSRRSAIWAGLNWKHADAHKLIVAKNWSEDIRTMKSKDFNAAAPLDGTNISVILDRAFFDAYKDEKSPQHTLAHGVYQSTVRQMLETGEPGFSVDYENPRESLRNAPVSAETRVLTIEGYRTVGDVVGQPIWVWTGLQWAKTVFSRTKENADLVEVELTNGRKIVCDPEHPFIAKHYTGAGAKKQVSFSRIAAATLAEDQKIASTTPLLDLSTEQGYGYGFVYGDGSVSAGRGELSVHTETKREAYTHACRVLGAHSVQSPNRAYFKCAAGTKEDLLDVYDSAFIAGWFDADGCFTRNLLRLSNRSREVLLRLQEGLNLFGIQSSVREDGESSFVPGNTMYTLGVLSGSLVRFQQTIPTRRIRLNLPPDWTPYRESEIRVRSVTALTRKADVYCCDVGVPEHSFMAEGVLISNCTEVVSEDDSDICNLGSINLSRISSIEDMRHTVELATAFLLAGTVYSDVPYAKVDLIRTKNRRLGLGLMGIHEWLLINGKKYGEDEGLKEYLESYSLADNWAEFWAKSWDLSCPIKTRALAPTGSIGILAETTTGAEPIFCAAYKRRYLKGSTWHYQYVVDPTAKRLIDSGVPPDSIEDAYDLARNVERRIAMQSWLQRYVDQAISSTINLPKWGTELNNEDLVQSFGDTLMKYLPTLRGVTVYPDESRPGQPIVPIKYATAVSKSGQELVEDSVDVCDIRGGSCGS